MMAKRKSIEKAIIDAFEDVAYSIRPDLFCYRGHKTNNRIAPPSWNLRPLQQFQFGDFRVELNDKIVVVETESGGGLTNLVKYWPLLKDLQKPLVLIHVFGVVSNNDLVSHRLLWNFLYNHMRENNFVGWLFTYDQSGQSKPTEAIERFRECVTAPWETVARL